MLQNKTRLQENALFFSFLALVLILRYLLLTQFAFRLYDSDQTIMWSAAIDYSHGIFHEPRFYGQAYSTMLEALLAVPLVWLSVPVYIALPVITTLLAIFPFVFIAFIARSRGKLLQACLVLAIPIFLPVEYGFLTVLSRGFVTGIFVASFGAVMLYYPDRKWGWILCGFCAMVGYSVNPNSLLLSAPALLYLWLRNIKNPKFYLLCGTGIIAGLAIHFGVALFYILNPGHNLHKLGRSVIAINLFLDGICHLDDHLGLVTPVFGQFGVMSLVLFGVFGVTFLFQGKKEAAIMAFAVIGMVLFSLSMKQVYINTNSVFYSAGRYFLGLPVLFALMIPLVEFPFKRAGLALFLLTSGMLFARSEDIEPGYKREFAPGIDHFVSVASPQTFGRKCERIFNYARQMKVTLVVEENDYFYDFVDYGCAACNKNFPATLRPVYERRVWRLQEEQTRVHRNIMIVDLSYRLSGELKKLDHAGVRYFNLQGFYFILGNKQPTLDLLKTLNISIRPF